MLDVGFKLASTALGKASITRSGLIFNQSLHSV
jgi:hypothetical protein